MRSPMERTLKVLREKELIFWIAERWNPYGKRPGGGKGIREDAFGIIDVFVLDHSRGVVGVQVCGVDFSSHWKSMTAGKKVDMTRSWLMTPGAKFEIWSWRKLKKKRGGKAMFWKPRIVEITLEDLE